MRIDLFLEMTMFCTNVILAQQRVLVLGFGYDQKSKR